MRTGGKFNLKEQYEARVAQLKAQHPLTEAMHLSVGGRFEPVGAIECALVRHYGLKDSDYLVDVGCGSGRLAKPLSADFRGRYLGTDLVADLIEYAKQLVERPDWRFEVVDHIAIPERDGQADMICFFSVLTHLLHEQSYWYLEEARRVLKPGGRIIFSFLEFEVPAHWTVFEAALQDAKGANERPLAVFIERSVIRTWAGHLELKVEEIRGGPTGSFLMALSANPSASSPANKFGC